MAGEEQGRVHDVQGQFEQPRGLERLEDLGGSCTIADGLVIAAGGIVIDSRGVESGGRASLQYNQCIRTPRSLAPVILRISCNSSRPRRSPARRRFRESRFRSRRLAVREFVPRYRRRRIARLGHSAPDLATSAPGRFLNGITKKEERNRFSMFR